MNNLNYESILVTGGAGFIGTHLCRALIKARYTVTSLDLKARVQDPVAGVTYLTGDARDLELVLSVLHSHHITALYHLAATVSVPLCQQDALDSHSNNVMATLTVLEACKLSGQHPRFAFASSAALYGDLGNARVPLHEGQVSERFSSFYAAQKHASEKAIELYYAFYQIPALIFRFFNVYGQGQDPSSPYSGVITVFAEKARKHEPIVLYNSGVQTRDFIPVTEIVRALIQALDLAPSEWDAQVINLGTGVAVTVRELAQMIVGVTGSLSQLVEAPARPGDVLHSVANVSRAQERLSFYSSFDLRQELSRTLKKSLKPVVDLTQSI